MARRRVIRLGRRSFKIFEVEDGPSLNISRTTIFDCEGKYELTKNGVQDELGVLIEKIVSSPQTRCQVSAHAMYV